MSQDRCLHKKSRHKSTQVTSEVTSELNEGREDRGRFFGDVRADSELKEDEQPNLCYHEASDHSSSSPQQQLGCFERPLTIRIPIAMILGTAIGALVPAIPDCLEQATVASIWHPGVILVWLMIYPMMLGIRWNNIREIGHHNKLGRAAFPHVDSPCSLSSVWTRRAILRGNLRKHT